MSISAGEGEKFAQTISDFKEELEKLGPIKPEEYKLEVLKEEKVKEKAHLDEI